MFEIPEGSRTAAGRAVVNLLRLAQDENITAFVPVREFNENQFVFMATANGIVKKTNLAQFQNPLVTGIIAVNLDDGDRLIGAQLTDGTADVILVTHNGTAIRFSETEIRARGRKTRGVRGINLKEDDVVVTMVTAPALPDETGEDVPKNVENDTLLIVTENGYGKRTRVSAYRAQKRGGRGIIAIKKSKRNGAIVAAKRVTDTDELVLISSNAYVTRMRVSEIRCIGRKTEGVRMMTLQPEETVVDIGTIELEEF